MLRLLFFLVCLTSSAFAQLKWEKPWQEFDRTPEDGHLATKFSFKNTGPNIVKIKGVKSSCGCTSAALEKKVYAPGESGEILAKFTFGSRRGTHRKQIVVTTDQGERQELDFVVSIEQALTVTPALVFWKVGQPADAKLVQLTVTPGKTVRIKAVTSSNPRVIPTLQTLKAGEQYQIAVRPGDTMQKETAELTVQTDYPLDAPRSYTIHARVK
ncbi:MAG TPA: DUF1573 domain-containing protein [Chthoniobacteraceae bacterium]|jgi:hypothetical protein